MKESKRTGVYQLENGFWGFRFTVMINGKKKDVRRTKDEFGNVLKTEKSAIKARDISIHTAYETQTTKKKIQRRTVAEVYDEYCKTGRYEKAYSTIRKQDSLWNNHISEKFGSRFIDEITVSDVNDYLSYLYYEEMRAYRYVEGFLKMFYLIFGQAYSRNYLNVDTYNTLCVNKNTKIRMPKLKINEDMDIKSFDKNEIEALDEYFKGTNAETAYMLGRYCGLRINECYGLKWEDIDFINNRIRIERQMQYQNGVIKLVLLKTRNARRNVYMNEVLKDYLLDLYNQMTSSESTLYEQRQQNQTILKDTDEKDISSLLLVNSLPNGKRQTVNSMKYHSQMIKKNFGIEFKYHYLRHTYGTILAEQNTPAHILCNQMGHGNANVTQKYYLAVSQRGLDILKNKTQNL